MEYLDLGNSYIIRLDPGDEIVQSLETFCENKRIKSGRVMGIGAIRDTKIGYFDLTLGDYKERYVPGDLELTSLMGNISMMEGTEFLHLHITATDSDFKMMGGHLISAIVSATAEIFVDLYEERIERKLDPELGTRKLVLNAENSSI